MKNIFALALCIILAAVCMAACSPSAPANGADNAVRVGLCSYVDDASLDQIVENVQKRLNEIGAEGALSSAYATITAMRTRI